MATPGSSLRVRSAAWGGRGPPPPARPRIGGAPPGEKPRAGPPQPADAGPGGRDRESESDCVYSDALVLSQDVRTAAEGAWGPGLRPARLAGRGAISLA